jgi:hypothetical protein
MGVRCGRAPDREIADWHDSDPLWRYTLSVTERNFMAHDGLGRARPRRETMAEVQRSGKISYVFRFRDVGLGVYEQTPGHVQDATGQYQKSLGRGDGCEIAIGRLGLPGFSLPANRHPNQVRGQLHGCASAKSSPQLFSGGQRIVGRAGGQVHRCRGENLPCLEGRTDRRGFPAAGQRRGRRSASASYFPRFGSSRAVGRSDFGFGRDSSQLECRHNARVRKIRRYTRAKAPRHPFNPRFPRVMRITPVGEMTH